MVGLKLNLPKGDRPRILLIGAHSDDIEIGVGGTVLSIVRQRPDAEFKWAVLSGSETRATEAEASAKDFLSGAGQVSLHLEDFQDGFFPAHWSEIKTFFEQTLKPFDPHLVFTHQPNDMHQDHRTVSELTLNTFRNHLILGYEIPKYDGDFGTPNVFCELDDELANLKIEFLKKHFATQASKHWFREDLFRGTMAIRGMECASGSGFAEAFYGRKLALDF